MRYLTVEEVLEINAEVMGGGHTLRDLGLLESAVARPQASAFGADAYPDWASKAAALLHSLVLNHAFVDGNKRTAVLSTLVFLDLNGYVVRWDQQEALDFVLRLATHQIELKDAIIFLHSKIHPKDAVDSQPSTQ
jgi:death-on-curing protein